MTGFKKPKPIAGTTAEALFIAGAEGVTAPVDVPADDTAPPWANAHPKLLRPYSLRLRDEQHMKLVWVTKHLPAMSMQTFISSAIDEKLEKVLKEHYKDQP